MNKLIPCVALALVVAGCSTSDATTVRGPDGQAWKQITCKKGHENCVERAGEECPRGYVVGDQGGHSGMYVDSDQFGTMAVPTYHGHMLVKCK